MNLELCPAVVVIGERVVKRAVRVILGSGYFHGSFRHRMKKTLEEFLDFSKKRMKPSHICQPVMIKTLIDCGGSATVRQIAQAFLLQYESQIQYYEERVKEMPIRVLKKHGLSSARVI